MEYAYATCILNESGEEINEQNLKAVLEAAGCPVQESRVKAIVAALEDIEITTGVDFAALGADPAEDAGATEPEAASESPADDGAADTAATEEMDIIPADPLPVEDEDQPDASEAGQPESVAGDGTADATPAQPPDAAEPAGGSDDDGG